MEKKRQHRFWVINEVWLRTGKISSKEAIEVGGTCRHDRMVVSNGSLSIGSGVGIGVGRKLDR